MYIFRRKLWKVPLPVPAKLRMPRQLEGWSCLMRNLQQASRTEPICRRLEAGSSTCKNRLGCLAARASIQNTLLSSKSQPAFRTRYLLARASIQNTLLSTKSENSEHIAKQQEPAFRTRCLGARASTQSTSLSSKNENSEHVA